MSDTPRATMASERVIHAIYDRNSTVGDLQDAARALVNEACALERELAAVTRVRDGAIKSSDAVCDSYAKENQRLSDERNEARTKCDQLELEVETLSGRAARHLAEVERLNRQLEDADSATDKARAEVERLKADLRRYDCAHDDPIGMLHCRVETPCLRCRLASRIKEAETFSAEVERLRLMPCPDDAASGTRRCEN